MAGNLKPDSSLLTYEHEAKCEILEYGAGFHTGTTPLGLLDGVSYTGWEGCNICYFYPTDTTNGSNGYFKFKVYSKCNIWAIGTDDYIIYVATQLKLTNKNGVDITSEYLNQDISSYSANKWIKIINELPPGEYYLTASDRVVIGEWYCELIPTSYIVKNNGNLYITNENNYDAATGKYTPVTSYDFDNLKVDALCDTPDYLNGLRPIDLFEGDIQLINRDYCSFNINGIKSSNELVVATSDINKGLAITINSLTLESTQVNNGSLKLAVSTDNGETWKTYDGVTWNDLGIAIPSTTYELMSDSELAQWNNARDVILANGIDSSMFNSLDFNTLTEDGTAPKYIRLAYTLNRPTYDDDVKVTNLSWDYNTKGNMDLMIPGTEYNISVFEESVKFKSLIDNDLIKVNFLV